MSSDDVPDWFNVAGRPFRTESGDIGLQGALGNPDGLIVEWFLEEPPKGVDRQ